MHRKEIKQNIILIGMPGAGKTTIGQRIATLLSRPFFDTDELIKKKSGRTIADWFAQGESYFRDKETEIIQNVDSKQGAIIATGGGSMLRKENRDALATHGIFVFIDRPLSLIKKQQLADRPLLKIDSSDLDTLYNARISLYKESADFIITNQGSIDEAIEQIKELLFSL